MASVALPVAGTDVTASAAHHPREVKPRKAASRMPLPAPQAAAAPVPPPTVWLQSVDQYPALQSYRFKSRDDMNRAIDVFYDETPLKGVPFQIVESLCLVVPVEAASALDTVLELGRIRFTSSKVLESSDVSAEKMARLRRRYKPVR